MEVNDYRQQFFLTNITQNSRRKKLIHLLTIWGWVNDALFKFLGELSL